MLLPPGPGSQPPSGLGPGPLLDFLLPFPRQRNTTAEYHQTRSLPGGRGAGSASHTHIRLFLTLSSSNPHQSASTLAGLSSAIIPLSTNERSQDAYLRLPRASAGVSRSPLNRAPTCLTPATFAGSSKTSSPSVGFVALRVELIFRRLIIFFIPHSLLRCPISDAKQGYRYRTYDFRHG